jgi:propanediol utilization protein
VRAVRAALLSLALLAQAAQGASGGAAASRTVTLTPSGAPSRIAFLVVTLGALPSGGEVEITGTDGKMLGSLSPYALRAGTEAGTYTVPLPAEAVHNGQVTVHLSLRDGDATRAPTADEVKAVHAEWGPED